MDEPPLGGSGGGGDGDEEPEAEVSAVTEADRAGDVDLELDLYEPADVLGRLDTAASPGANEVTELRR